MMKIKFIIAVVMTTFALGACGEKLGQSSKVVSRQDTVIKGKAVSRVPKMQPRVKLNYQKEDSVKVVALLKEAASLQQKPESWMLWFGNKLEGVPYVAGTLDRTAEEELIINLRELDCTTFVEQVLAMAQCAEKGKTSFNDFVDQLLHVRYIDGKAEYVNRQHYFTVWINDNVKERLVEDIQGPNPPFVNVQKIDINYMTTHQASYKMLKAHPEWVTGIRQLEQSVNGKRYRYIPKDGIVNTPLMRKTIHNGDIIAIITNKKGLDTTHIGIASWQKDGLHMLNASSIHHRVIEEPMLLRTYMMEHPVQIGIRIARPL